MQPRAIETRYKGYRFRSRLEARWAVFFDALGLKWEYEPEGFELPGGVRYLPDFKVTSPQGLVTWYEVKPLGVKRDPKFTAFIWAFRGDDMEGALDTSFVLLDGDPADVIERPSDPHRRHGFDFQNIGKHTDNHMCPRCGEIGITNGVEDNGDTVGILCERCDFTTPGGGDNPREDGVAGTNCCWPHKGWLLMPTPAWMEWRSKVYAAAQAARGARFEHGESGAKRG